jgi:hypothetical protein
LFKTQDATYAWIVYRATATKYTKMAAMKKHPAFLEEQK